MIHALTFLAFLSFFKNSRSDQSPACTITQEHITFGDIFSLYKYRTQYYTIGAVAKGCDKPPVLNLESKDGNKIQIQPDTIKDYSYKGNITGMSYSG